MKTFDFLCQELSVLTGVPFTGRTRYDLWLSMASQNAHPMNLTPEQAAHYLEKGVGNLLEKSRKGVSEAQWFKLVQRIRNFNPDQERPEEILERITRGLSGDDS